MLKVVLWDIAGGEDSHVVGEFFSLQVTNDRLRDEEGNSLLIFNHETSRWYHPETQSFWDDWTVEVV